MDFILPISIIGLILYSGIIFLLFIQKPRKIYFLHGIFIAFIFSFILWTVFNYLSVSSTNPDVFIWLVRAHMTTVILQGVFFDLFVTNHPFKQSVITKRKVAFLAIVFTLALIVTWTPILFESSASVVDGLVPTQGFAPFAFPFLMVLLYLDTTLALTKKVQNPINRKQAKYLELAHLLFFVLGFGLLFIPVVVFHTRIFQPYGALFTFPIALVALFSLLKLRLLEKQFVVSSDKLPHLIEHRIKKFWGNSTRAKWDIGQILFPPHKKFLKLMEQEVLSLLGEEGVSRNDLRGMMIAFSPEANERYLIRSSGSLEGKGIDAAEAHVRMIFSVVKKDDLIVVLDPKDEMGAFTGLEKKVSAVIPYKALNLLSKSVL